MNQKAYLENWMKAHRDELIADLSSLIAVRSVKGESAPGAPFGPGPARALDAALALCDRYGFAVRNYDGYVGAADLCDADRAVDILAHLDVVGEGPGWDTDPYTAVVKEDGYLYGRGSNDDKGPALAALYAMRAVRDSGQPIRHSARLILGTDEESGSGDLPYYFAREKSAPYTFSPDCNFPVYNTEKGGYSPVFTKSWPEQTKNPHVSRFSGGFRINVIPSDAEAVVSGMTAAQLLDALQARANALQVQLSVTDTAEGAHIAVKGFGAHASTPEQGNNGITALISLLAALPLAECESTAAIHELASFFPHGDGRGKAAGLAMEDELSGPLTLAFTLLSIDRHGLRGQFDSRVPICATEENCRKVFEKLASGHGYTVEGGMRGSHHTPADSPFIQTLLRCYEQYTGQPGQCLSMGGGTYVHDIEGGVAFGPGMPDFDGHAHGANERADIDALLTASMIYAQVLFDMCCGEAEK